MSKRKYNENYEDDEEIDPNIIHAALEQSQEASKLQPLNLKQEKPKRKYFKKKVKNG